MGAWLNGSATSARMSRESAIRGGYATGYYQPMIVPMGSKALHSMASVVTAPMQDRVSDDGASAALDLRNRQYNILKGDYERALFIMAGLGATVVYLFTTRNQS